MRAAPASTAFGFPGSDTPEIQKYKKRFNTDILCAALWGMAVFPHCMFAAWIVHVSVVKKCIKLNFVDSFYIVGEFYILASTRTSDLDPAGFY